MCGIAGIISKRDQLSFLLDRMIGEIRHRGPDYTGIYLDGSIGLAHARLSIIDTSSRSNQPLHDHTNRFSIVFNGEIFNYIEIRDELLKLGFIFNTDGDSEVLLNGYIHYGYKVFNLVRGFYALCIYDKYEKKIVLARDSFGKKPLYFYNHMGDFIFGSEIKSVLSACGHIPTINYDSLSHFLWKGYSVDDKTAYSDIKSLLPGQIIEVGIKNLKVNEITHSSSLKIEVSKQCNRRSIRHVQEELAESVKYRMVSDVPVSFLLSGGIDSSLISLIASKQSTEKINTYYMGYAEDEYDLFEELSAKVASKICSNHKILKMKQPCLEQSINRMINLFDEPFSDYSALPSYELYKEMSKTCKVAISGDGADEIFCGYKDSSLHLIRSYISGLIYKGKIDWLLLKIYNLVNSKKKVIRYTGYVLALIALNEEQYSLTTSRGGWNLAFRKMYMNKHGFKLLGKDLTEKTEGKLFMNSGNNTIERYINYDFRRLTYDFLVKVDRTSMSNSLEVRSPFLDTKMINNLGSLNIVDAIGFKSTKKELRSILNTSGLGVITRATKKGFTPPLAKWLQSPAGFVLINNMLKNNKSIVSELFDISLVQKMLLSENGIKDNYFRAWNLLLLDAWYKKIYL